MKKVLLCLTASIFLSMLVSPSVAGEPNFKKCDELKGAAWGLCKGAMASECDTKPSPSCDEIAKVVEQVTGQPKPTWICPCGDSVYFIDFISRYENASSCSTVVDVAGTWKALQIDTPNYESIIFSFYPGSYPKQTCGFLNTSWYEMTDDQASACISEVKTAAQYFGITCR